MTSYFFISLAVALVVFLMLVFGFLQFLALWFFLSAFILSWHQVFFLFLLLVWILMTSCTFTSLAVALVIFLMLAVCSLSSLAVCFFLSWTRAYSKSVFVLSSMWPHLVFRFSSIFYCLFFEILRYFLWLFWVFLSLVFVSFFWFQLNWLVILLRVTVRI